MIKVIYFAFFISISILNQCAFAQKKEGAFGIIEPRIIMQGNKSGFSLDNSGYNKSWLVRTWVESFDQEKTNNIISTPSVFRVNNKSKFRVNLHKSNELPDDKESVFWVVAHSVPELSKEQPDNKLNLAYRFKSLLIYRPEKLNGVKFNHNDVLWRKINGNEIEVYNNSPFAVSFVKVTVNGKIIPFGRNIAVVGPYDKQLLKANANVGDRINYGYKNDYGSVINVSAFVG